MSIAFKNHTDLSFGSMASNVPQAQLNAKIAYALFTGMVKDKVGYPIREYAKNAWEVSPPDKPFIVTLPTLFSPTFTIRDFGPGLDYDFMMERYPKLGDSTKDGEGVNGVSGWGFGSKSAFAYSMEDGLSGSYSVTSYQNGKESHYLISLDSRGMPQVKLFGITDTDEPDGLKVSFAVRREDINTFRDRARDILWSFTPRPIVTPDPGWKEPIILSKGEGWTLYDKDTVPFDGPQVRVGCVMYPIDMNEVQIQIGFLSARDCLVFDVAPDAVQPTASRENLQYTGATKDVLLKLIVAYERGFVEELQKDVVKAKSYFEACSIFHNRTVSLGSRRNSLYGRVMWRNIPIKAEIPLAQHGAKVMVMHSGWREYDRFEDEARVRPYCLSGYTVVVEHRPGYSAEKFAALGLVGKSIIWVRVHEDGLDDVLSDLGVTKKDVVFLDQGKVKKGKSRAIRRRRVISMNGAYGGSVQWETIPVSMTDGGVYLMAPRKYNRWHPNMFRVFADREISDRELSDLVSRCVKAGIITNDKPIKALVKTEKEDLDEDKWFWVGDYLEMRLRDLLDQDQFNSLIGRSVNELNSHFVTIAKSYDFSKAPKDLKKVCNKIKDMIGRVSNANPTTNDHVRMALKILCGDEAAAKESLCPIASVNSEADDMIQKYPLLETIMSEYTYGSTKSVAKQTKLDHYFSLIAK